jgi:hypothetical protein
MYYCHSQLRTEYPRCLYKLIEFQTEIYTICHLLVYNHILRADIRAEQSEREKKYTQETYDMQLKPLFMKYKKRGSFPSFVFELE